MPVYYHPVINESLRNSIDSLDYFFKDGMFRDRFELNHSEAENIQRSLENGDVCEHHQKKYFKCKRHVNDTLNTQMDLMDVHDSTFEVNYPDNCESYAYCELHNGGTGAGKTYEFVKKSLRNLNGKKSNKRKFIIFSPEMTIDKTLEPLRQDKYRDFVTGVDTSDRAFGESEYNSPEQFFNNEIKRRTDHCEPGTILFLMMHAICVMGFKISFEI